MDNLRLRAWDKRKRRMLYRVIPPFNVGLAYEYDNGKEQSFDPCGGEDNYELMIFTGLKDKNGKEIYEGDILYCRNVRIDGSVRYEKTDVVKWSEQCSGWYFGIEPLSNSFTKEVIGNIYENPELLKDGKNASL